MREQKDKKGYQHLTQGDMIRIETLREEGFSNAEIGIKIGKHKTTIGRWKEKSKNILRERTPQNLREAIEQSIIKNQQDDIYHAEYVW